MGGPLGGGVKFVEKHRGLRQLGGMKFLRLLPVLLALGYFAGCGQADPPAAERAPSLDDFLPKHAQAKLRTMKVYLGAEVFDAELALTETEVMTGMMYRTNIQETDAMLFTLPVPQRASFWMRLARSSLPANCWVR